MPYSMGLELNTLRRCLLTNLSLDLVNENLSVAIVGFGKMGILHSTILNLIKPGIVKFIVDKSRLITFGSSLLVKNVKFFSNLERMLREDVDAIYITTPIQTHYSIAKRALEAGIRALFLEKPPTVNLSEFTELMEASKGSMVMVGFQKRYALPFRHAKILINKRIIGDIKEVKCSITSGDVLQPTKRFSLLGRGVLLDLGIHLIDLLCWLFGYLEVKESESISIYTDVDDFFKAKLSAENFEVEFKATWSDNSCRFPKTFIEVVGGKGILKVSEDYVKFFGLDESDNAEINWTLYKPDYYQSFPPVLVSDPEYTIEDLHFLSCLTKGARPETGLEYCATTMRLLEELYKKEYVNG
jgi:predicted dehydrogenase